MHPRFQVVDGAALEEVITGMRSLPDARFHFVQLTIGADLGEAIMECATALDAPDYFGRNLDALYDVLGDRPKGADVLVIQGMEHLSAAAWERLGETLRLGVTQEIEYGDGHAYVIIVSNRKTG